jgi:hypothetical protein
VHSLCRRRFATCCFDEGHAANVRLSGKLIRDLDMRFKMSKSVVLRFGKRFKKACKPLTLDGGNLQFYDNVKYLGVVFKSGTCLSYDFNKASMSFYRSFNNLLSKCKLAKSEIICSFVLQKVCIPILTYAFEVLRMSTSVTNNLDKLINCAIRRIFNINSVDNICYVRQALGIESLEAVRKRRSCKFLINFMGKNFTFRDCIFRIAVHNDRWLSHMVFASNCCADTSAMLCTVRSALAEI